MEQRVATLTRSDQISRDANRDLQGTLAERDEEIAGLRADVAFYERFVGATAQRRGLDRARAAAAAPGRPGLALHRHPDPEPQSRRGQPRTPDVSVEGTRDGALQRLSWADLRQQPDAPGAEYSFKYFQQVEGDLVLPARIQAAARRVRGWSRRAARRSSSRSPGPTRPARGRPPPATREPCERSISQLEPPIGPILIP